MNELNVNWIFDPSAIQPFERVNFDIFILRRKKIVYARLSFMVLKWSINLFENDVEQGDQHSLLRIIENGSKKEMGWGSPSRFP